MLSKYSFIQAIVILFVCFFNVNIVAQNYEITFNGIGESVTVDSVYVENLTQNIDTTISGNDTLLLNVSTGVDEIHEGLQGKLRVFPNPTQDYSKIIIETNKIGNTIFTIHDISGRTVFSQKYLLKKGCNLLTINGLTSGVYTLTAEQDNDVFTSKIICTNSASGNISLDYNENIPATLSNKSLKSIKSTAYMQYNNGDLLKLTGKADNHRTIIMLKPLQSQETIFNFKTCRDNDSINYAITQIGDRWWMAENLNVGVIKSSYSSQMNNLTIEKYCYNDDEANCDIYGGLYQWYEMMNYQPADNGDYGLT
ncbi:MAG: hypothetical protein A2W98_05740 [Bacteroidetes bacterium GWF2_33_38]|nr:MAG: hypothetical protein A2W98_05740 [Bacteroidetes bacterium GWF2_33_38]HBX51663.1 hypothetical protein [Bacteroidales bacterium]